MLLLSYTYFSSSIALSLTVLFMMVYLFQAFGEYLIGPSKNSGAHKLYYPNDYTASVCREMMGKAKGKSLEARYEVFEVRTLTFTKFSIYANSFLFLFF